MQENYAGVSISLDLTHTQRSVNKKLQLEKTQKNQNLESSDEIYVIRDNKVVKKQKSVA